MLNRENFKGPWAGLPVAWKEDYSFDEKTYRENIIRCCKAGIPGVYTGGTTGEFYAQDFEEFKKITRATVEECKKHKTHVMIGCSSTYTIGVIKRAEFAKKTGAEAIQVTLPFWLEVPDKDVVRFFKEISRAVPNMPISIYDTLRTKKRSP